MPHISTVPEDDEFVLVPADAMQRVAELRAKQTRLRQKVTLTCNAVTKAIKVDKSRTGAKAMYKRASQYYGDLDTLNDDIMALLDSQENVDDQHKKHLVYASKIDDVEEELMQYLASRDGEEESVCNFPLQYTTTDSARLEAERQMLADAEERAREAREKAETYRESMEEMRKLQEQADLEEAEALKAVNELKLNPQAIPVTSGLQGGPHALQRTGQWVYHQQHHATALPINEPEFEAPDDWIQRYLDGVEEPLESHLTGCQSLKSPLPEPFTGIALHWFNWAETFYSSVHHTRKPISEKLTLLKKSLAGSCSHYVMGAGESAYREGLKRLRDEFGKRDVMRAALCEALKNVQLPSGNPTGFKKASMIIRAHLFELSQIGETQNSDIINRICQRLQLADRLAWNEGKGLGLELRTLNVFGEWLCNRADAYQNVFSTAYEQGSGAHKFGASSSRHHSSGGGKGGHHVRTHKTAAAAASTATPRPAAAKSTTKKAPYCFKCEGAHRIEECDTFKKMPFAERQAFAIRHNLCFMCLYPYHDARNCSKKKSCGIGSCTLWHHALLHQAAVGSIISTYIPVSTDIERVALGIIQLFAHTSNGELISVNVLYDECSTSTLFRVGLIRQMRLRGVTQILNIHGVGGKISRVDDSKRVQLQLRTETGEDVQLQGSTVDVVADPVPVVDWVSLKERWSHLAALPLRSRGGRVDILLGLDYQHLMLPMEIHKAGEHEPVATKTKLGWMVRGVLGHDVGVNTIRVNSAFCSDAADETDPELLTALKRLNDTESFGSEYQKDCISPDNQKAIQLLDSKTVKLTSGPGYQAPVLWKEGEPALDNNFLGVQGRHRSLVNRFRQDPDYEKRYRTAMKKNFDEGYAIRLTEAQFKSHPPVYFLPHFGVLKKWTDRDIRIVFDAAAKYRGKCLNDCIHGGPALQNPLPSVLIKFREGAFAWASDIKAMFSRIRLCSSDQRYHGFLWPEEDGSTTVCQMTRVTFGVNCSPFVAIRTTWRTAEEAGSDREKVEEAIKNNVYVDDYLDSAKTLLDAVDRASAVKRTLASGDFHLQPFVSNSPDFLQAINGLKADASSQLDVHSIGTSDAEMILGIAWHPAQDVLGFRVAGLKNVTYTRAGLISKVAGVFDPLGTAAPIVIKGRIRLRRLGTSGVGLNDKLEGEELQWWMLWVSTLSQLADIEIPRCLFPNESRIVRRELHTFCDASEEAYCAVIFIRMVYDDGKIVIRNVKAGTKLAPVKTLSIPKLELNAALLGSRMARFVQSSLTRKMDARFFWTDSATVRNWVRATAAYYQVFVSHRIGEIQTITEQEEWRFVPGKLNPSDAATRSMIESEAIPYCVKVKHFCTSNRTSDQ